MDKHYKGEGFVSSHSCNNVTEIVSVRLSIIELDILRKLYPDNTLSFAIRSLIHAADIKNV